jgi:pimeloyl-ACP methyl ester carboxylesterase
MRQLLIGVGLACLGLACAGGRSRVRDEAPLAPPEVAAPLDAELRGLPGARAVWMPDAEYGGDLYVVVVEPPGGARMPTLVLVHGLGTAGVRDFYPVLPALARGRRVVAFDLPGFARSRGGNERYTPARYAAVVARVIDRYGGGPVDLLGHSMGGAIALMHAGTYPGQVRRLVLVDAAGILHREAWFGHHLRRVTDPAGPVFPAAVDELNQLAATVLSQTRALDPLPDLVLLTPALRQKVLDGDPGRIAALSLILTDFSAPIEAVAAPALVVWGGIDQIAPLRTGELLSDRLPRATFTVLAGVGHNVMADAPVGLLAAVEPFLSASKPVPRPASPRAEPSRGDVTCSGQSDLRLSGTYDDVVLDKCQDVSLDRVSMRHLVMRESSARAVHAEVASGVVLARSRLLATGGRIEGDVPLDLTDSDADLAGVALDARRSVYRLSGTSKAIFSVCPVQGGRAPQHLHGVKDAGGEVVEGGLL